MTNTQGVTVSVTLKANNRSGWDITTIADCSTPYDGRPIPENQLIEKEMDRLYNLRTLKINTEQYAECKNITEQLKSAFVFLPEEVKDHIFVIPSILSVVLREQVWNGNSALAKRIENTLNVKFDFQYQDISELDILYKPFIYYMAYDDAENDALSFNASYIGLRSLIKNQIVLEDLMTARKMDWRGISNALDKTNTALDRIEMYIRSNYCNIFLYDNCISLYEATHIMKETANMQANHQNGYAILKGYFDSLEDKVEEVDIVIGSDIISGWYMNHTLITIDSPFDYGVTIYTFDPLKSESDFIVNISEEQNRRVDIVESDYHGSVELGDNILTNLISVIASRHAYYTLSKYDSAAFSMDNPVE